MEDKKVVLNYEGEEKKIYFIVTRRPLILKKGEVEVTKEEKEELKKSRIANDFKEFRKPKKKESDEGGGLSG